MYVYVYGAYMENRGSSPREHEDICVYIYIYTHTHIYMYGEPAASISHRIPNRYPVSFSLKKMLIGHLLCGSFVTVDIQAWSYRRLGSWYLLHGCLKSMPRGHQRNRPARLMCSFFPLFKHFGIYGRRKDIELDERLEIKYSFKFLRYSDTISMRLYSAQLVSEATKASLHICSGESGSRNNSVGSRSLLQQMNPLASVRQLTGISLIALLAGATKIRLHLEDASCNSLVIRACFGVRVASWPPLNRRVCF